MFFCFFLKNEKKKRRHPIRQSSETETHLTSVERILEYAKLIPEKSIEKFKIRFSFFYFFFSKTAINTLGMYEAEF